MPSRVQLASREASWDRLSHSDASGVLSSIDDEGSQLPGPSLEEHDRLFTVGDVRRALHPLQAQADRVGRQVEEFATTLDRLSTRREINPNDEDARYGYHCPDVMPLAEQYESIASKTVARLRRRHGPEARHVRQTSEGVNGRQGRSSAMSVYEDVKEHELSTSYKDLEHWEQERQTWELLELMLEVKHQRPARSHSELNSKRQFTRPARGGQIHRYSSEKALWAAFLAEDDEAWEKHVVLEWLRSVADGSGETIDEAVRKLGTAVDQGAKGHGWLSSKEAIKGQKRLRSWPQPLEPSSPGMGSSLIRPGKPKDLVTQLDPDAFSRQERELEKEDTAFERATWLGCWEMVRRGRRWDDISEWCKSRLEGWRALPFRGDPRIGASDESVDPKQRLQWRLMCVQLARNGGIDKYEKAVYGALGGDLPSVFNVCLSWDDHLFALLQCQITLKYNAFVAKNLQGARDTSALQPQASVTTQALVDEMMTMPATKTKAFQPLKMLQASIITGRFAEFIQNQGAQLVEALEAGYVRSKDSWPAEDRTVASIGPSSTLTVDDHDMLRVLAHMVLIYQEIDPDLDLMHNKAAENIVFAYVDFLAKAGKIQLLPLYASRLSPDSAISCMARVLIFITETSERKMVMGLMKEYEMESCPILMMQVAQIMENALPAHEAEKAIPKLSLLTRGGPMMPPTITTKFIGERVEDWQIDLIHAFEWFLLLEGSWQETLQAGTHIYKHLLRTGALAAARALATQIPFARISRVKTRTGLGQSIDLAASLQLEPDRASSADRDLLLPSEADRRLLLGAVQMFRDLEALVLALDAFERWAPVALEAELLSRKRDVVLKEQKDLKKSLRAAYEGVVAAVEPLMAGWLMDPADGHVAAEAQQIRVAVLPEIVLAYCTVLCFAGHSVTRDCLLECMNVAAAIAADGSDLAQCFKDGGRVAELVDLMAIVSRELLKADELGIGAGKAKRGRRAQGETLDIWTVRA